MSEWLEPGKRWQRVALAVTAPLAVLAAARWWTGGLHGGLALAAGIVAFLLAVLSFPPVYRAWESFGEAANRVVVGAVFLAVYVAVVPLFSLIRLNDRLGLRARSRRASFWVERRQPEDSIESMLRMG